MTEITVNDGQRHIGTIIQRPTGFEAFDAAGGYLCKGVTIAEARAAVRRADVERRAALPAVLSGAPAA